VRILVANIPAAEEESSSGHFIKNVLVPLWRRNLDMFRQSDVEFTFRFPKQGPVASPFADCHYLDHVNLESIFPAVAQADKEGFKAVIITCFGDPMLREARQAVSIPVVSIGESSMLLAIMMGCKFGVVVESPVLVDPIEHRIAEYGFKERSVGIRSFLESGRESEIALTDARHTIESFKKAARKLIADGAEVILPSCGLISPALRLAPGAENEYPNGLTEVDGIPIVDLLGSTLKMAEMLVALNQAGACVVNRKRIPVQAIPCADDSPGFWDY
jgi:Asp/Glu/hydantoin racemase